MIQPFTSPWASPILLEENEAICFCIDYHKVNAITQKDTYTLPRIDDTLDTLAASHLFCTTLDPISGYWQVIVCLEHHEEIVFGTPEGLYEFKSYAFRALLRPATFH